MVVHPVIIVFTSAPLDWCKEHNVLVIFVWASSSVPWWSQLHIMNGCLPSLWHQGHVWFSMFLYEQLCFSLLQPNPLDKSRVAAWILKSHFRTSALILIRNLLLFYYCPVYSASLQQILRTVSKSFRVAKMTEHTEPYIIPTGQLSVTISACSRGRPHSLPTFPASDLTQTMPQPHL